MVGQNSGSRLRCALFVSLVLATACGKPETEHVTQGADQDKKFDLVCVGRLIVDGETEEPFRDRFRVDLEEGTWCRENCQRIYQIAAAEPGKLQLSSADVEGQGNSLSIDRVSGELYGRVKMDALNSTTFANCASARFSGFPKTKF